MATPSSKKKVGGNCRPKTELEEQGDSCSPLGAQMPGKVGRARSDTGKTRWKMTCSLSTPPSPTRYRPRSDCQRTSLPVCASILGLTASSPRETAPVSGQAGGPALGGCQSPRKVEVVPTFRPYSFAPAPQRPSSHSPELHLHTQGRRHVEEAK